MKLTDLIKRLFIRGGQYLLGELDDIGMSLDDAWELLKPEIDNYARYVPYERRYNVNMSTQSFHFLADGDYGMPAFLTSVLPITRPMSTSAGMFRSLLGRNYMDPINRIAQPQLFRWEYDLIEAVLDDDGTELEPAYGLLVLSETVNVAIRAAFNYNYVETRSDAADTDAIGPLKEVEIQKLPTDTILYDILTGRLLQSIGRMRRSFTHSEMVITTDAEKLVSEGETMYEKGLEKLYDRHKWQLSIRPG